MEPGGIEPPCPKGQMWVSTCVAEKGSAVGFRKFQVRVIGVASRVPWTKDALVQAATRQVPREGMDRDWIPPTMQLEMLPVMCAKLLRRIGVDDTQLRSSSSGRYLFGPKQRIGKRECAAPRKRQHTTTRPTRAVSGVGEYPASPIRYFRITRIRPDHGQTLRVAVVRAARASVRVLRTGC